LQVLIGFYSATQSQWGKVDECLGNLGNVPTAGLNEIITIFTLYLSGARMQGRGSLDGAMARFIDRRLQISDEETGAIRSTQLDLSILTALNRIWIMQHPDYRDNRATLELIEKLRPLCVDHQDPEIKAAFYLALASVQVTPPISINQVKNHLQISLNLSKAVGNQHLLAISLSLMRHRLFENVVGDQATKSAKAASVRAQKAGNLLWISVAEGMMAQSHEVQGQMQEAEATRRSAIWYADRAFSKNS
jgi:hypothetical protein